MERNFWLNVILLISTLICFVTGFLMDFHLVPGGREVRYFVRQSHIYSGYVMALGIIFHIIWHISWIKSASKNIYRKHTKETKIE